MRNKLVIATVLLAALAAPAFAHRLNEYLQATLLTIGKDQVAVSMRLIPGVDISSTVVNGVDTDRDGIISEAEGRAYARLVLADVSLRIDGIPLEPELTSVTFPAIDDIKEGTGEIHIEFTAALTPGRSSSRTLVFENHHQSPISAYLVNTLMRRDRDIRVISQHRTENQSSYELEYAQDDETAGRRSSGVSTLVGSMGGFGSMFRLGLKHIAEGTDHLLFLLALLLPAPLIAFAGHWTGFAGVRRSLLQILRIVTAFTLGHSTTLALAVFGVISVPSRPIEILIALSILISAVHAVRPLFPGREPAIAAFFGLIHGLAFAATLGKLGLGFWERVTSLLGFNLGIESMQLFVVAATMPSLLLLSRTRAYSAVRTAAALFAGVASLGWIAERLFNLPNSIDTLVENVAHQAIWIAYALLVSGVASWCLRHRAAPLSRSATVMNPRNLSDFLEM